MNSRERVLNALNHKTTDRIPIALVHGYWMSDVEQLLKERYYLRGGDTLDAIFHFDTHGVEPFYRGPVFDFDQNGHYQGIFGTPENSLTFSQEFYRPLVDVTSIAEIEAYPWPKMEYFDFSTVKYFADLYKNSAIISPRRWSPIFCQIADFMGFETAMMYLYSNPKIIEALVEKITDWNCEMWTQVLDAAPGQIDICYVGDDPAGQEGMMIDPRMWRKFFKNAFARLFDVAKSRHVRVMFHICGNATAIIPDLIEIGMDILMPVQVAAKDMDPVMLKREYGADISFFGGMDTQHVLPESSPEQVRAEVRRLIDSFGKSGGYIFSSSHNITNDIPIENIIAMYEEAAVYYPF